MAKVKFFFVMISTVLQQGLSTIVKNAAIGLLVLNTGSEKSSLGRELLINGSIKKMKLCIEQCFEIMFFDAKKRFNGMNFIKNVLLVHFT